VQRLPDLPELDRTPATLALLGQGCQRCQRRWQMDARVAALIEEARSEARLAAGTPHTTQVQDLPAPTPSLPAVAAATPPPTSARRNPDPHYYTRLPWPPEDTS
jgi:hypothetical protein